MKGYCEDCRKEESCQKVIGMRWGYCETDFEAKCPAWKDGKCTGNYPKPYTGCVDRKKNSVCTRYVCLR